MMKKQILRNQNILGLLTLFYFGVISAFSQSKAHDYSKFAIIDPAYSSNNKLQKLYINEIAISWIYGPAELECWRLKLLQQRKDSAQLNVGYPGTFHKPYTEGIFRLKLKEPQTLNSIKFKATGNGKIYINDTFVSDFKESSSLQTISLKKSIKAEQIQFDITDLNDLPTLLVESKGISTSDKNWEWKSQNTDWDIAFHFPQNRQNIPPHRIDDPSVKVTPVSVKDNLYDFSKELFGYIIIRSQEKPVFNIGESESEALDFNNKTKEQSLELKDLSGGLWKTKSPLAFRFVYLENNQIDNIWTEAIFHPVIYKGAFACSDSILTKIWMNSAYTLRLCMHDFLLDGVKRDRLPWAGDLAMSLLVNAYSFSDRELVRRSLVALGRAGIKENDINGIVDYSLWWIISQDQYQLYYGDSLHLMHEWSRIKETLDDLSAHCDSNGFLVPRKEAWLFIDWVNQEKWTALQILWWWAQNSGAKLAQRVGDTATANYWMKNAQKLKVNLSRVAWSEKVKIWLSKNDTTSENTRHPNFLAIVSGLATPNQFGGIKALLENNNVKPVGTPYMKGFEVMALSQLGNTDYMLNKTKDYWGGMLNRGATTFWEAYDSGEASDKQYSFYGRPYGKSLCHAWSSGPAAFLPSELFGLKPLEDGWKRFTIHPNLCSLHWASICLPTNYGNIIVDIVNKDIQISIPKGTTLEWKDNSIVGPRILKDKL